MVGWQFQLKAERIFPRSRRLRPPAGNAAVKFLIRCADVDLQMLVADAAGDVAAKLIAAEPAARVSEIEAHFATGPNERRLFRGQ